jgi:BirA family biotin operon repressor/biotin-[acetyl-CoA-carboxylase] ligase
MGAAPPPWRVQEHEDLASTQDAAIEAARAGDPGRLGILARTQTAGRGSRGRSWIAPAGNLNFSVLLRPERPLAPGLYALLAGVALHKALSPFARHLMLKWPNDLLLDGGKLGGILVDASFDAHGTPAWFVIGIGANLASAPHIQGRETAALPPPAPSPRGVADAILRALDNTVDIAADWLVRAHPIGTRLHIETPQRHIDGTFKGITGAGELLLAEEARPISSGEVFLGLYPTPGDRGGIDIEAAVPDPQRSSEAMPCCS